MMHEYFDFIVENKMSIAIIIQVLCMHSYYKSDETSLHKILSNRPFSCGYIYTG